MQLKQALSEGYSRSAASYDQTAGAIYLRALWGLLPYVDVAPSPAILDIGCGTGINLLEAARVLGPCSRLVGVDLSPGMVSVARRKAVSLRVSAAFIVGDAEALDLEDGAFDLVICNSVYHWFSDRAHAIREFSRLLRPGGQLILASLAEPGFQEWSEIVGEVYGELFGSARPSMPAMPAAPELTSQLRAAGLGIEHFKYQIEPNLVTDVQAFVSTMAIIAPSWVAEAPDRDASRLVKAMTAAIQARSPSGFTFTQAAMDVIARKGTPRPPVIARLPPGAGERRAGP